MNKSTIKEHIKYLLGHFRAVWFGIDAKREIYIGKNCSIKGKKNVSLHDGVMVRPNVQIWSGGGTVEIGSGSEIGERCRISIANQCRIGQKVLLSPNVYITDCDHEYRNVDIPVIEQGVAHKDNTVSIDDGSYIGINAVIVGNVHVGKHCVVGANSVLTSDMPDYSVAVGSPAKIIKRYSLELHEWRPIKQNKNLNACKLENIK